MSGLIRICFQITDGALEGFNGGAHVTERCQTISIVAYFGVRSQRKCIRGLGRGREHLMAQKLKRKIDSAGVGLMKRSSAQPALNECKL